MSKHEVVKKRAGGGEKEDGNLAAYCGGDGGRACILGVMIKHVTHCECWQGCWVDWIVSGLSRAAALHGYHVRHV